MFSDPNYLQKHTKRAAQLGDDHVYYYSRTTVRKIVRAFLTLAAVAYLVGPLFALYYVRSQPARLGLIAGFCTVFAISLSFAMQSRNYEIFAALAA
jgi:hypothetical protein